MANQSVKFLACAEMQPANSVPAPNMTFCRAGESAYLLQTDLANTTAFDPQEAASFFGFGFGVIVFFFLLGLKGSVLLRPFWASRY